MPKVKLRSVTVMATIWEMVFNLPNLLAAIITPSAAAIVRRPVTKTPDQ